MRPVPFRASAVPSSLDAGIFCRVYAEKHSCPTANAYAVPMPESAQPASSKNTGFASFFTSFTNLSEKRNDDWDISELADDVATISYEQALRSCRAGRAPETATEKLQDETLTAVVSAASNYRAGSEKQRKGASITLRLTASEQAQLHQRAASAKLSVSAYIRSCIFEVESLRIQVKEALAQMQSTSRQTTSPNSGEKSSHSWRSRFLPAWSRRRIPES